MPGFSDKKTPRPGKGQGVTLFILFYTHLIAHSAGGFAG